MYYEYHHIIPQCKPFNGSSKPENMVYLTFQEHFLVHWLLTKMCINTNQQYKMNFAFRSFLRYNKETQDRNFTSKHFSILKTHARNNMQGENHPFYGKIMSEEQKLKISKSNKGKKRSPEAIENIRQSVIGRKTSIETKKKLSIVNMGENNGFFGKHHSDETKQILKEKSTGNKNCLGNKLTEETKDKLRQYKGDKASAFGKPWSDERKEKLRQTNLGKIQQRITCPHCNLEGGISAMKHYHFDKCKQKI